MPATEKYFPTSAPAHPATIIFLWGCLTVAMQSLPAAGLLLAGAPLLLLAGAKSFARLATLLRRTRWIMLSLLLIYGYATPGAALWGQLAEFSPTVEGVSDGLLQLCRLVFALAGLAILSGLLSRQQLIVGLYTLAYPLRYLGLSRERLAVRLALTLYYAEAALVETAPAWHLRVEDMLLPPAGGQQSVELQILPFTPRDGLLVALGLTLLAWVRL